MRKLTRAERDALRKIGGEGKRVASGKLLRDNARNALELRGSPAVRREERKQARNDYTELPGVRGTIHG